MKLIFFTQTYSPLIFTGGGEVRNLVSSVTPLRRPRIERQQDI